MKKEKSNILIADSGSTKTHWMLLKDDGTQQELFCTGINPYFMDENQIVDLINKSIPKKVLSKADELYFYGAGCSNNDKCTIVNNALSRVFANSKIEVSNDLLASARALFGSNNGIACILGTGSNAAVYNGVDFDDKINSLGYMLGDEGSGAYIGKRLLIDFLHNDMPKDLYQKFAKEYNLNFHDVLDRIYKQDFPNRYLASFTPFASKNIKDSYIIEIIESSFDAFIKYQLDSLNFDKATASIGFVGSIAYHFKEILQSRLELNNYKLASIISAPMDGLVEYYS